MTNPIFSHAGVPASKSILPGSLPIPTYQSLVNECAKHRFNYPIANGSPLHARILIAKLFEIAEREVVIVSGRLLDKTEDNVDVYGHEPVIGAAKTFLSDPNAQLSIILQEGEMQDGSQNRFFRSIVNDTERGGVITVTTPKKGVLGSAVPHFMITDRSSYRIETGLEAMEKIDRMTAVANFGDKSTAADLRAYFDEVIDFISSGNIENAKAFGPEVRI